MLRREPREYCQKIVRLGRDAGLSVRNQLDYMYNGLDFELRRDIKKPKAADITVDKFIDDMDDCKYDWWGYASRRGTGGNVNVQN